MVGAYCADPALQTAVEAALNSFGLEADPAAVNRRPPPAWTAAEQMRRIDLGRKVVALVRQWVPVGADDRRLIERLVDSAFQRPEEAEAPRTGDRYTGATEAAVVAYAAAGGGAIGTFEEFRRTFTSSAELLEPPAAPAVDRQDVKPPPLTTNPNRRPNPPGTATPAKTNPTRTIRSSRWTHARKGVKT
jgi:hypothetical protein